MPRFFTRGKFHIKSLQLKCICMYWSLCTSKNKCSWILCVHVWMHVVFSKENGRTKGGKKLKYRLKDAIIDYQLLLWKFVFIINSFDTDTYQGQPQCRVPSSGGRVWACRGAGGRVDTLGLHAGWILQCPGITRCTDPHHGGWLHGKMYERENRCEKILSWLAKNPVSSLFIDGTIIIKLRMPAL